MVLEQLDIHIQTKPEKQKMLNLKLTHHTKIYSK